MTSFAKTVSGTSIDTPALRPEFEDARHGTAPLKQESGSSMVAQDRPHPAPRPSPDMASDVDRAAFNVAWEREQRRAAFIAMRTDPQSGGRILSLNRSTTR